MSVRHALMFAGATLLASPALLAPAAAHAQDARVEATRLAALLIAEDQLLALVGAMAHAAIDAEIAKDKDLQAFYRERPVLLQKLRDGLRTESVAVVRESLPAYRAEVRDLLLARMSARDLKVVADFLESPAGKKLYFGSIKAGMDAELAGVEPDVDAIVRKLLTEMSPAELKTLEQFDRDPAGLKLGEINAALEPISARWTQRMAHEAEARGERVVANIVEQYEAGGEAQQ